MKVISFINYKGGTGKTTILSALALYWAFRANKRVAIQDMEQEGGATSFVAQANTTNLEIFDPKKEYDFVLIDTEGNISKSELSTVVGFSDLVVIPMALTPLEIAKTYNTFSSIPEGTDVVLLINKVRVNTTAWKERAGALEVFPIKPLESFFKQRTAYANFLIDGWSALDKEAVMEIEKLAWELS